MARYVSAWLAGTAAVVVVAVLALDSGSGATDLETAVERAACRMEPATESDGRTDGALEAALRSGKVVVRYRVALSARDTAEILDLVRRVSGRAIAAPDHPSTLFPVVAQTERERLGCPTVDGRAAEALELFILRSGDGR